MTTVRAPLAVAVVAALLVACTGGDQPTADPTTTGPGAGAAGTASPVARPEGVVRIQGCEPRSLLPAGADGPCGQQVTEALYSSLVDVDRPGSSPAWGSRSTSALAADITSDDGVTWRIELKEGWTFHDGQPVTAQSVADAWNLAASGPNAQPLAHLFEPIVGFDDVSCPEVGCEPEADELAGVEVVDERVLEVELSAVDRLFPRRLGHVAFAPLPPAALEDLDAFVEAPVGSGPFRMEGPWRHDEEISLRAYADHPSPPAATGVEVVIHEDARSAWDAFTQGELDVVTSVPPDVRREARGFRRITSDGHQLDVLVVPAYRPDLHDLAPVLSRAIDREAIIDEHLGGLATPARGLVPPAVAPSADRCGSPCRFDPAVARRAFADLQLPDRGIEVWVDLDAGQGPWAEAVVDQWRTHLELDAEQVRVRTLPHTAWVTHLQDRRVRGLYPLGWTMDVASPLPYLQELHGVGGLFNLDGYRDDEVEEQLDAARAADTTAEAEEHWRAAEQRLLDDMHAIPLWVRRNEAYAADIVDGLAMDARGLVRLTSVRLGSDG